MVQCAIPFCRNRKRRIGCEKITFHKVPLNPTRRSQWASVINRRNWQPTKNTVVCSMHFLPADFEAATEFGKNRRLRVTAVPSQYLGDDRLPPSKAKKIKIVKVFSNAGVPDPNAVDALAEESWAAPIQSTPVVVRTQQQQPVSGSSSGSNVVTRYVRLTASEAGPRIVSTSSLAFSTPVTGPGIGLVANPVSTTNNAVVVASLKDEISTLKGRLSEAQLKNMKLDYEKKVLKKERDNFEKLLGEAESRSAEADRIKTDLNDLLDRPFENVEEIKNSIRDLLSGNQILPDFF